MQTKSQHLKGQLATMQKKMTTGWAAYWLLWPFGALVSALNQYKNPAAKNVFWLFCLFYGLVFIVPHGVEGIADSARYTLHLIEMHKQDVSFTNLLYAIYNPVDGYIDLYQPVTTWFIAIFTDDPKWLFALFAMVFGYFYSRNLWLLLEHARYKITWFAVLILLGFALVNPLWNINGVRMWTAAQIFVYGILLYTLKGEKKSGILWIASSALVHFSFLFPIAVFFIYLVIPEFTIFFFFFYIATAFVNEINLYAVRESLSFMPQVFQPRIVGYTNSDYALAIKEHTQQSAWHVKFAQFSGRFVIYIWTVWMFLRLRQWSPMAPKLKKLFSLALFIGGWANLASSVPSGGRFTTIANMLLFAVIFALLISLKGIYKMKMVKTASLFFLIFFLVFQIRTGFDHKGFLTFFGNPLASLLISDQTPVIDFIKGLF